MPFKRAIKDVVIWNSIRQNKTMDIVPFYFVARCNCCEVSRCRRTARYQSMGSGDWWKWTAPRFSILDDNPNSQRCIVGGDGHSSQGQPIIATHCLSGRYQSRPLWSEIESQHWISGPKSLALLQAQPGRDIWSTYLFTNIPHFLRHGMTRIPGKSPAVVID